MYREKPDGHQDGSRTPRPQAMIRQISFGSFTTEDMDIFHNPKSPHPVNNSTSHQIIDTSPAKYREAMAEGSPMNRKQVRRSQSIGGLIDNYGRFEPVLEEPIETTPASSKKARSSRSPWLTSNAFHQSLQKRPADAEKNTESIHRTKKSHSVRNAAKCLALVATAGVINESEIQQIDSKKKKVKNSESSKKADSSKHTSEDEQMKSDLKTEKKITKLTKLKNGETKASKKGDSFKSGLVHKPATPERIIEVQRFFGSADVGADNFLLPNFGTMNPLSPRLLESSGVVAFLPQNSADGSRKSKSGSSEQKETFSELSETGIRKASVDEGLKENLVSGRLKLSTINGAMQGQSSNSSTASLNEKENSFEELLDVFEKGSKPIEKLNGSKKIKPPIKPRSTGSHSENEAPKSNTLSTRTAMSSVNNCVTDRRNLAPKILVSTVNSSEDERVDKIGLVAARVEKFSGEFATASGLNKPRSHLVVGAQKTEGGLSRVESLKLSHAITRKMSRRQKRELMMESEFDEFDDIDEYNETKNTEKVARRVSKKKPAALGIHVPAWLASSESSLTESTADTVSLVSSVDHPISVQPVTMNDETENNSRKVETINDSDVDSDDEWMDMKIPNKGSSGSDDSDCAFEEKIVVQLNIQRLQDRGEADDSCDDIHVVEMDKLQRIATELLTTEKIYIKKLHLVDQLFHFQVVVKNRELRMFPDEVIPQIFSNIKSLYQFHHDFLLPQLEKRMSNWNETPMIGDVMKKFAPFLKLYVDYVQNFDRAMDTINYWMEKSPKFARLIEGLQKLPECGHLTLQHHMLEPIQRVPRYQLLLRDYQKHLTSDSPDFADTEKAVELVTMAATHANDAMRRIEKFRKLLDINESLGGTVDLISPTRELVKDGRIERISARDGDRIERYIFLFTDLVLVCQSTPAIIGSKQQYRIKTKLDMDGLEVIEGHNLDTPNTFYVKGQQMAIELHTSTAEEKAEWQQVFANVITEYNRKLLSRREKLNSDESIERNQLGLRAPTWIKDQETSMCMQCTVQFTTFRRRHHCRACGIVVCAKCSSKKFALAYHEDHRESRVCNQCYAYLKEQRSAEEKGGEIEEKVKNDIPKEDIGSTLALHTDHKQKKGGRGACTVLQVKASDPAVISGYLMMTCDKKTWSRRWFTVHENFVLYSFKAHQDVVALTSMPLPGYQVCNIEHADGIDLEHSFKVLHVGLKKIYYFQADDKRSRDKWMSTLRKVVLLELPSASDACERTSVGSGSAPTSPSLTPPTTALATSSNTIERAGSSRPSSAQSEKSSISSTLSSLSDTTRQ